jgi:hypothetical protein
MMFCRNALSTDFNTLFCCFAVPMRETLAFSFGLWVLIQI